MARMDYRAGFEGSMEATMLRGNTGGFGATTHDVCAWVCLCDYSSLGTFLPLDYTLVCGWSVWDVSSVLDG